VLQAERDPEVLVAIVIEVPSRRWTDKASDFREIEGERETETEREAFFYPVLASAWLPQSSSWPQSKPASPSPPCWWVLSGMARWEGNGAGPLGPPRL
jgi:hypothetical protein